LARATVNCPGCEAGHQGPFRRSQVARAVASTCFLAPDTLRPAKEIQALGNVIKYSSEK